MIAPIQTTETPPRPPGMRRARRLVATTFLERQSAADDAPPVPSWKAWLFTGWVVAVTAVYFAYMLGVF